MQDVAAIGDFIKHGFVVAQVTTALVYIGQLYGLAEFHFARIRRFFACNHFEQSGFTRTVRADDADNRTRWDFETQVINQHAVAKRFGDVGEFNHFIAQTLGGRDEDFLGFIAFLVFEARHFFKTGNTCFGFGLAAFGILTYPFQFLLHRFDARGFLFGLGGQAVFLLLQPRRVIAFPRNAMAAVQFQNPFGGIVEEVAVMRYRNHGTREAHQELLQPFY